jgi:hypothetical protein
LRGELETLRPSGFGVFSPQEGTLYVEESMISKLSGYETSLGRRICRVQNDEL